MGCRLFTVDHGSTLTLYHIIPNFNDPEKEVFRKKCGKRRKCWLPAFSPFPTMFSTLSIPNFIFSVTFFLPSANAFNLDQSKILSFGKKSSSLFPDYGSSQFFVLYLVNMTNFCFPTAKFWKYDSKRNSVTLMI